jgi:hypothetical protein
MKRRPKEERKEKGENDKETRRKKEGRTSVLLGRIKKSVAVRGKKADSLFWGVVVGGAVESVSILISIGSIGSDREELSNEERKSSRRKRKRRKRRKENVSHRGVGRRQNAIFCCCAVEGG